jgi:hypothetical protein
MCVVETFTDEIFINDAGQKTVRQLYKTKRGKNKYRYVSLISCEYCKEDFVPTRRGVHKYCSNSCRSRACKKRNNYVNGLKQQNQKLFPQPEKNVQLIPVPTQQEWNWMRFLENLAASGSISFLQHQAVKDMINENGKMVISEIRHSELRNAQRMKAFIEANRKDLLRAPKPYNGIDAKDFEDIAKKLL